VKFSAAAVNFRTLCTGRPEKNTVVSKLQSLNSRAYNILVVNCAYLLKGTQKTFSLHLRWIIFALQCLSSRRRRCMYVRVFRWRFICRAVVSKAIRSWSPAAIQTSAGTRWKEKDSSTSSTSVSGLTVCIVPTSAPKTHFNIFHLPIFTV